MQQGNQEEEDKTTKQKMKRSEYAYDLYNLYAGGLLVVILVLMQGVIGVSIDSWLLASMAASAIAIPPLSGMLIVNIIEKRFSPPHARFTSAKVVNVLSALGFAAALVAVTTAFCHVGWVAGVAFLVVSAVTCGIYVWYISDLEE